MKCCICSKDFNPIRYWQKTCGNKGCQRKLRKDNIKKWFEKYPLYHKIRNIKILKRMEDKLK